MDDEAASTEVRKMIRRRAAAETQRYTDDEEGCSQWAFHVGVVTMFFGFLFLALGIPILADLFLKLSERLHQQEEQNGTHPGSNMKADISPWI